MKSRLPLLVLFLLASSLLFAPQAIAQAPFPLEIRSWWQNMMNWRRSGRMMPPVIIPTAFPVPTGTYGWQMRRVSGMPYPSGKVMMPLPDRCPPITVGDGPEALTAGRKSYMECLLRVEEQKFGQLEQISQKLEARKTKIEAAGKAVAPEIEAKLDEVFTNIQSAKGDVAAAKAKIRSLDLDKSAAEVKEMVRPEMERLVNESKLIHGMQQGLVEQLRAATVEQIRGRSDGRWQGYPAE